MSYPFLRFACLFSLALLLGCGGSTGKPMGTARGRVTFQGAPVTNGSVVFNNAKLGVSQVATLDGDGSYLMRSFEGEGLPVGTYKVAIQPGTIARTDSPLATDPTKVAAPPPFPVPKEYYSPETSPLSAEVKEGANADFNFDIKP